MFKNIVKVSLAIAALSSFAFAEDFNAQAEKDRVAMQNYYLKKFENPLKNKNEYFPYVDAEEIKKSYIYPVKLEDFSNGVASWYRPTKEQLAEINEFPPYEIELDEGKELLKKPFANGKTYADCFGDFAVKQNYPYFDTQKNEIVTIGVAINQCRTSNGEKPLKYGKGDIAKVAAAIAFESRGKKIDIKIPSEQARLAYESGKEAYYTQRGNLNISCAECHVAGSGQKIRQEALSPELGHTTHFPVYRIKWGGLGTLQRRLQGCVNDTGSEKPAFQSKILREIEYYVTYMSNGLEINGPDTRK